MSAERAQHYTRKPLAPKGAPITEIYHRKKAAIAAGTPTTLAPAEQLYARMPDIYTARGPAWRRYAIEDAPQLRRQAEILQLYVKATKADVGGVGGHVVVDPEVQSAFADFILRYNRYRGRPIFRSVFFTHTGDDVCAVGTLDERMMEHPEVVDELLWNAFMEGARIAKKLGNYAPGQDLKADTFSGNLKGMGPGSATLKLPFRPGTEDTSQTVVVATADKTEPGSYNYIARGAYLDPNFNTGLLIAKSDMKNGYLFKLVDVDTKEQAIENGVSPADEEAMNEAMERLGNTERSIMLSGPEDLYDIGALTMNSSRYVIAEIWTKNKDGDPKELGYVVPAERLHNIKDPKTGRFVYGGKDDPVLLSLAQGNWPAPGEIVSPLARIPIVAGDCRGSHFFPWYPVSANEQTSLWSGPIVSVLTASINLESGIIGSISDQLAKGTPWDDIRNKASAKMVDFRDSQGYTHPGTLGTGEMEYQDGFNERMARLNGEFTIAELKK